MALFLTFAALMLAVALAIVLRPLLSAHAPNDPAAAARRRLQALNEAHATGILDDAGALDPAALTAPPSAQAPAEHGADMEQAIAGLAAKLNQNPADVEGWALLGRAYLETQRFAEARDALQHAHDIAPGD